MPQAAVDGISLYYERHGAGEPVLLIQGMSGTHLAWGEAFMAGLGDGLDIAAYNHRGVGDSTPPSSPTTRRACSTPSAGTTLTCWASRWAAWSPRSSRCAIGRGSARSRWAARTPVGRGPSWPTRP